MKWSLFIGKPFGTRLYIHWTFLFLLFWIGINAFRAGASFMQATLSLIFMMTVFTCVLLHEMGHAYAGKKLGYITRRITLLPIGGVASMDEIPSNPRHELVVTLAGPAVNLVLAFFCSAVFISGKTTTFDFLHINTLHDFISNLFVVNVSLLVFNLIPAFPMDGGRILRSLLTLSLHDRVRATGIASSIGKVFSVLFFIAGIFFNPFLAIIGIAVFLMAHTENEMVKSGNLLSRFTVADVLLRNFHSLHTTHKVDDAVKLLLDVQATDFVVLDEGKFVGTLSQSEIVRALSENGKEAQVKEVMNTNFVPLNSMQTLDQVYPYFSRGSFTILPVFNDGKLIGIVDGENIREFILVQQALEIRKGVVFRT